MCPLYLSKVQLLLLLRELYTKATEVSKLDAVIYTLRIWN